MRLIDVDDFLEKLDEMWSRQKGFSFEDIRNVAIFHTPTACDIELIIDKIENLDVTEKVNVFGKRNYKSSEKLINEVLNIINTHTKERKKN